MILAANTVTNDIRAEAHHFDCDGVLVDSEEVKTEIVARHLAKLGISITGAALIERFSGVPDREMYLVLQNESGIQIPAALVEEARAIKLRECATYGESLAMPGIHQCLDGLSGIASCVASSSSPEMLEQMLRQTRLWDRFAPNVFSARQVRKGKPAPDLFLFAAERMEVAPEQCLVIEDSLAGIEAARAAAMASIGFIGGGHCAPDQADRLYRAGAQKVVSDMSGLTELLSMMLALP